MSDAAFGASALESHPAGKFENSFKIQTQSRLSLCPVVRMHALACCLELVANIGESHGTNPASNHRTGQAKFKRNSPAIVPRALESQAIAEISSAIGTLAFSGAALYGLAMSIRSANKMDEMDARLAAETKSMTVTSSMVSSVELSAAPLAGETAVETSESKIIEFDSKDIEARAGEARSWIGSWKKKTEETEAAATAAAAKAKAEEEAAAAAAATANAAAAEANAAEAKSWIGSWKKKMDDAATAAKAAAQAKAEEEAAAAAATAAAAAEERKRIEAAHAERMRTEQAQAEAAAAAEKKAKEAEEKALAAAQAVAAKEAELKALKAQSAQKAAAVIKEMTEDAPVGVQKSTPSTREPAVVGVTSSDDATQKVPLRRVSITAEYENKISSLVANYEKTKQRQREVAMKQPKQVVEISAEELARVTRKTNPVIMFFLRIVAMIQACFEYVKSLFSAGSGSAGSPAATA